MRVVLIGFTIVLVVLCCGLAIRYNQDADYAREELNGELYKRMVAEEGLLKANIQIDSLKEELKRADARIEQIENVLEKTKEMNGDLKVRLYKAEEMKEVLEKKISDLQTLAL